MRGQRRAPTKTRGIRPPARPPAGNIVSCRTLVRCTYVSSVYASFDFLSLSGGTFAGRGEEGRDVTSLAGAAGTV